MGKHRPPDIADDERPYEVGYRRPSKDTRFRAGEGGNRKGRKRKKQQSLSDEVRDVLTQQIKVRQGGKTVTMSMLRAILQTHATKAAQGNSSSTKLLIELAGRSEKEGDADVSQGLSADDQNLLLRFVDDVAAGNKSIDGSFPEEPVEYKKPWK